MGITRPKIRDRPAAEFAGGECGRLISERELIARLGLDDGVGRGAVLLRLDRLWRRAQAARRANGLGPLVRLPVGPRSRYSYCESAAVEILQALGSAD